jgi:hypothetical protein
VLALASLSLLSQKNEVKLPACPKTWSAVVSVVSGVLYSSTRLFPSSAM